ncbi:MAG TPA: hypothetical protein VNQ90_04805 [Chthoniobacteraceae bacterium]|nr:hypothetical protein [Chthoniobacteraceae bacterium]
MIVPLLFSALVWTFIAFSLGYTAGRGSRTKPKTKILAYYRG